MLVHCVLAAGPRSAPVLILLALGCAPESRVQANNAQPDAVITSHGKGAQIEEGLPVLLRGQVSDPDDGGAELRVTWRVDQQELCAEPASSTGESSCEILPALGMREISLEVVDPRGAAAVARVAIEVVAGNTPELELLSPVAGERYYSDVPIPLEGRVSDAEQPAGELSVWWEVAGQEIEALADSEGIVRDALSLEEGSYFVTLHAVDITERHGTAGVALEVGPPNSPPSCEITSPAPGTVLPEGDSLVLGAYTDDAEVGPTGLVATWSSDLAGELGTVVPGSDGAVNLPVSGLEPGEHVIGLSVADEVGLSCSDSVVLEVVSPPGASILAPADGEVANEGTVVGLEGEVWDAEDAPSALALEWRSSVDGTLSSGAPDAHGRSALSTSALSVGAHTISLSVTDRDGLVAEAHVDLRVNGLPSAPTVSISPDPADSTMDLVASASGAVDAEGDPISYTWSWLEDGLPTKASTGPTLPASATVKGRSYTATAVPDDGLGSGPAGSAALVVQNAPPSVASVSITPASPSREDSLSCSWSGYADADGDPDLSTVEWTVDGAVVGTGTSLGGGFDAGALVLCTVTPFDGEDAGTPASASVSVANSLPVGISASLAPDPVRTADTLYATASATDADGDVLSWSYSWTVDGAVVPVSGSSLSGVDWFDEGQEVAVVATPSDSVGPGSSVSAGPLVVQNSAPGAPEVELQPEAPMAGFDDLVCELLAEAEDADGELLSYEFSWTVDGSPWGGSTSTTTWPGDTIEAADTLEGQSWECTVTAEDGDDLGPPAQDSVLIQPLICGTRAVVWWDGEQLMDAVVEEVVPAAPNYLTLRVLAREFQSANADLDDLIIRDLYGNVVSSSDFSSEAGWQLCQGWLGANEMNGVATATSDEQQYQLEEDLVVGDGLLVDVDVRWSISTDTLDVRFSDGLDSDCIGPDNLAAGVTLNNFHVGDGPDVAWASWNNVDLVEAPWVEPADGWHRLSVLLADSCLASSDWDLDGDGSAYGDDCDDRDPDIHPGASDPPADGIDADCDGVE